MPSNTQRNVRTRVRRRTRNARNRARTVVTTTTTRPAAPVNPGVQRTFSTPKAARAMGRRARVGLKISNDGMSFLKCAFASPDFSVDPGKGIPDKFEGRTLSIKDCLTTSLDFTPGTDTYILVSPVPGYAYFKSEVAIGADPVIFTGVHYPTYQTNFGNGNLSNVHFSKFRYASLAAGIYPTSNFMQYAGSVSTWKVDLNLGGHNELVQVPGSETDTTNVVSYRVMGLQGVVSSPPRDNVSVKFIDGSYAYAYDKTGEFDWNSFYSADTYASATVANPIPFAGKRLTHSSDPFPLMGMGNTNTIVYKVTTPTGAVNSAVVRTWNCIELQPNTDSALYQFSGKSPSHDPAALEVYNRIKAELPIAVAASDNAGFWSRVVGTIRNVFRMGTFVGGPLGLISGGLETITSGIQDLFF